MHISKMKLATVLLAATAGVTSAAWAQRAGQSISIQHGVVTDVRSVDLQAEGNAAGGALIGGIAGYALSGGRRNAVRNRNAILGTAIGAAAASAGPRRTGMQYTVSTASGTIVVVSDQREIRIGDCVTVENAGTGAANIRRASPALCESPDPLTSATEQHLQNDAADCLAAKDAVLAAESDEDVARAIRAARIACDS
jgi:outer membrane lipoprotein SlyB